jgi:hypothetical protein
MIAAPPRKIMGVPQEPAAHAIASTQERIAMKSDEDFRTRVVRATGTIMMLGWILILGPIGALLLGGTAYAMFANDPTVGVFCGVVIFFPLLLTSAWGAMKFLELHRERRERRTSLLRETEQLGSPAQ